ncbi:MAG: purine-nucleoside phosphorylase [Rhizobiaceae bacterium]|nr:purine-nucleoside phosphorylase [Rhizobiaceae bacterium]
MTPHNSATKGDYAEAVLLPGDPLRAKWIAETILDGARCVNRVRNCLGYTGTWKGKPVSVQATGMGQPSLAIYVHELINVYGAKQLIRVGTCGGLSEKVKVRDLVLALTASTDSSMNRNAFGGFDFAPAADFALLRAAATAAEKAGVRWHAGGILSSDVFYQPDGLDSYAVLRAHGIMAVEMETSALYTLAARFGAQAVSICTMTDCLVTGEELNADERQSSLEDMARIALDVAVGEG